MKKMHTLDKWESLGYSGPSDSFSHTTNLKIVSGGTK